MKAQVKVNPRVLIEIEGEEQKDLFAQMAQAHEVFSETKCGLCASDEIRPVVRTVEVKKKPVLYYEYHCKCGGRLSLSQNADGGTLFVNRKLLDNGKPATGEERANGKYGKHNGWTKYKGEPVDGNG